MWDTRSSQAFFGAILTSRYRHEKRGYRNIPTTPFPGFLWFFRIFIVLFYAITKFRTLDSFEFLSDFPFFHQYGIDDFT